ncbi:MAG: ESPR-type extended signal peptide-containing protein, partial [Dialister micraerophilus]|uniref:ESPR-type extended signal peptide-containing protein n=1 Tax=Dialister micraerophilus TaxID=309120 RepID=UPI0025508030
MNKIYKLVWSKVRNTWVVASEIAKGHGKDSSSEGNGKLLKSLVLMALLGSFVTAGIVPVAALTKSEQAVYNAVMQELEKEKKTVHYFSVNSTDPSTDQGEGSNYKNDGATGKDAVAIGNAAKAKGERSTALGNLAQAEGGFSTAFGQFAQAKGDFSTALGNRAEALRQHSTALGYLSKAHGNASVALGTGAKAKGNDSTALGQYANAQGEASMALGNQAQAEGNDSTALGYLSVAKGTDSMALGRGAIAQKDSSMALGRESKALVDGSVALGEGTVADRVAGAIGYSASAHGVSFYDVLEALDKKTDYDNWTRIIDASKEEYEDLKFAYTSAFGDSEKAAAKAKLDEWKGVHQDFVNALEAKNRLEATWRATKAAVSVGRDSTDEVGNRIIESRQITNVAAGTEDTDAVNVAQLKALNTKVDKNTTDITELTTKIKNAGSGVHYFSVNSDDQNASGGTNWKNDGATGEDAIAIGRKARAYGMDSQSMGDNAWSIGNYSQAWGYYALAGAEEGIDKAAYDALSDEEKKNYTLREMTIGGEDKSLYYRTTFKEYTNDEFKVLSEQERKDLTTNKGYGYHSGKKVWTPTPRAIAIGHLSKAIGAATVAVGNLAEATGIQSTAIGTQANASGGFSFAAGDRAKAQKTGTIAIGMKANASGEWSTAVGSYAEASGEWGTALGLSAKAQSEHGVALGASTLVDKKDAVSIGYKAKGNVETGVALGAYSVADREKGKIGYALGGDNSTLEKALESVGQKAKYDELTGKINLLKDEYNGLVKDYQKAPANSTEEKTAKEKLDAWVTAHPDFLPAVKEKQQMIGAWQSGSGAVSVGSANATRQIINVAAGTKDTDAVNVAQLKVVNEKADKNATDITNLTKTVNANAKATKVTVGGKEENADGNLKITKKTKDGQTTYDLSLNDELTIGKDGKDGKIGINGKDGKSAEITVGKGEPGVDGKDGVTRIIYKDKEGKEHEVATLDDGLKFKGDNDTVVTRKLNQQLNITGGIKNSADLSDGNIGIVGTQDGGMEVKLSKKLKGLSSAEFKDGDKVTNITAQTITQKDGDNITDIKAGDISVTRKEGSTNKTVNLWNLNKTVEGNTTNISNLETTVNNLKGGFTIKDAASGTANIGLGDTNKPAITFKAETENKDGATSALTAKVDANKNVTYTLNTKKLKEEMGLTHGVGSMSSWKLKATGDTDSQTIADGDEVEFEVETANKGLTVKRNGKKIQYGIDANKLVENINSATTKITNVDGDNIDLSKNNSITKINENITKLAGKATKVTVGGKDDNSDDANANLKITKKTVDGQTTYDLSLNDELTIGKDGKDGKIGINGKDGKSAEITVGKGEPGVDGKDGVTRIIYKDKEGKEHEVATLDDGLKFKGDNDTVVTRKLNQQLNITGGIKNSADLSDGNIGIVGTQDGGMEVKLSKKLKGLSSAEFKDGDKVTNITAQTITQKDGDNITDIKAGDISVTRKEGSTNKTVNLWNLNKTVEGNTTNISNLETTVNNLKGGFTIKDAASGTANIGLGDTNKPAITFKAETENTDGATSALTATVDDQKNVTYKLNTKKLKEEMGLAQGVGSMSSWKLKATGDTASETIADGNEVEFAVETADKGLTVKRNGKKIQYGIDANKLVENINSATTKITNVDGDKIDISNNKSITEINKKIANVEAGDYVTVTKKAEDGKGTTYTVKGPKLTSEDTNLAVTDDEETVAGTTKKKVGYKLQLSKTLKGLTSVSSTTFKAGDNVTLGTTGLTITNGPSVTTTGIDAGKKKITNVTDGAADGDAVNFKQLKDVKTKVEANENNITTNKNSIADLTPKVTTNTANIGKLQAGFTVKDGGTG